MLLQSSSISPLPFSASGLKTTKINHIIITQLTLELAGDLQKDRENHATLPARGQINGLLNFLHSLAVVYLCSRARCSHISYRGVRGKAVL